MSRSAPRPARTAANPVALREDARVQIDLALHADYPDIAGRAHAAAAAGAAGLFTLEANRDVFFPLLVAAQSGAPVQLYPNVAIAFPRSPMHVAYQAWDLQRISGGRFALGLGSQIRPHIEKRYSATWHKPVPQLREFVAATRAIFACFHEGRRLDFRGDYYTFTLMTPTFVPAPLSADGSIEPPPIWTGALGPLMTSAAAQEADGVIIHPFNSERYLREHTLPRVDIGLAKSGRSRDRFTVIVTAITCCYDEDDEPGRTAAIGAARANLAFYASTPSYRVTLDAHGWGDLQPELNALSKAGRWADMAAQITDEMVDTLAVHGTPERVGAEIRRRYAGIADRVALSVPGALDGEHLTRLLAATRN
jgi:probable F420-dependent oxidoreductase